MRGREGEPWNAVSEQGGEGILRADRGTCTMDWGTPNTLVLPELLYITLRA